MFPDQSPIPVNSSHLPNFIGQSVRLACKPLKVQAETAIVQASDGGEVTVRLNRDANIEDPYVDIIGSVIDATTIKMLMCCNRGSDLDMKLVNDVIEFIHDPRFHVRMFTLQDSNSPA